MLLSPILKMFPSQPLIPFLGQHSFFHPAVISAVGSVEAEYSFCVFLHCSCLISPLSLTPLWPLTHHQFLLHSRLFGAAWVCVCALGWHCRLLLLYHLLLLFCDPVLRPLVLGLLELILTLVVGVVLGVQLAVYATLQKKKRLS